MDRDGRKAFTVCTYDSWSHGWEAHIARRKGPEQPLACQAYPACSSCAASDACSYDACALFPGLAHHPQGPLRRAILGLSGGAAGPACASISVQGVAAGQAGPGPALPQQHYQQQPARGPAGAPGASAGPLASAARQQRQDLQVAEAEAWQPRAYAASSSPAVADGRAGAMCGVQLCRAPQRHARLAFSPHAHAHTHTDKGARTHTHARTHGCMRTRSHGIQGAC